MNEGAGNFLLARNLWIVARLIAAVVAGAGVVYAFRASVGLGVLALLIAVGLTLLAFRIDRRTLSPGRANSH